MTEEQTETSTIPIPLNRSVSPSLSPSTSVINGPGLAKPVSSTPSAAQQRIDAALEKNLETIVTQVRRTTTTATTKTSELNENDLQLFDSPSTSAIKYAEQLREMTPDSINEDAANGYHPYPSHPYGQLPWPPHVYPYQPNPNHPGLYLPYPPFYPHPFVRPTNEQKTPGEDNMIDTQRLFSQYYPPMPSYPLVTLSQFQSMPEDLNHLVSVPPAAPPPPPTSSTATAMPVHRECLEPDSRLNKSSLHQTFSRLSPDLSSDGGNNDADSILSFESQKSNTATQMPVLEDGLSDSEETPSTATAKRTKHPPSSLRHQTTQHDSNIQHRPTPTTNIPSNKSQFARSTTSQTATTSKQQQPQQDRSITTTPGTTKIVRKKDYDTDEETDKLLGIEHRMNARNEEVREAAMSKPSRPRQAQPHRIADPENSSVFIEGVLYRCRYLGSTQLLVEGNPTKVSRMMQAQEVVDRIKAPDGEHQPSVDVDLFISTEKIMVLNTDLEDILMDHSLRSISYIADIGELVVLMAKRRYLQHDGNDDGPASSSSSSTTRRVVTLNQKMVCHVFESEEAQSIAQSIGQAFQVAYVEFLRANGIDDPSFTRDIDYQEVLDQQEMGSEELDRFARKECQKEAIVTKAKNEPLGIVIVESGWGSMLPTVVIANMMPGGPAARGGQLNIGDQIISVNGISLVGLPLSSCQTQIKNVKHLTTVRLLVVPCPPVVEVLIRRPDTKYQLGFSVQNGIICSLLRGGIAERGGVRVGHRIIEINGQSVVATPHERIVSMLSHSVGELRMKTMPTQMYRLLTGQETPIYI